MGVWLRAQRIIRREAAPMLPEGVLCPQGSYKPPKVARTPRAREDGFIVRKSEVGFGAYD